MGGRQQEQQKSFGIYRRNPVKKKPELQYPNCRGLGWWLDMELTTKGEPHQFSFHRNMRKVICQFCVLLANSCRAHIKFSSLIEPMNLVVQYRKWCYRRDFMKKLTYHADVVQSLKLSYAIQYLILVPEVLFLN